MSVWLHYLPQRAPTHLCPPGHPWVLANEQSLLQFSPDTAPPILPTWQEWVDATAAGLWRLQETSGSVAREHAYAWDGTYSGGVTLGVTGPLGGGQPSLAARFTGGYVTLNPSPEPDFTYNGQQWSYSFLVWMRTTSAADMVLLEIGSADPTSLNGRLRVSGGAAHWETWDGSIVQVGGGAINNGAWHLIIGSSIVGPFGSTPSLFLYVDGVQVATGPGGGFAFNDAVVNEVRIGGDFGGGRRFAGDLAEAMFYLQSTRAADAAAWYAVGQGVGPIHSNVRGINAYGAWRVDSRSPTSHTPPDPAGAWRYLQSNIPGHLGPFTDASGRIWFLGSIMRWVDYPIANDNRTYWGARWDATARRLLPVFYCTNPTANTFSSPARLYGGIGSVCDDGAGGLFVLGGEPENNFGQQGIIMRWDGIGDAAASTLPGPTMGVPVPADYWNLAQYVVRTAPYAGQGLTGSPNWNPPTSPAPPGGWVGGGVGHHGDFAAVVMQRLFRHGTGTYAIAQLVITYSDHTLPDPGDEVVYGHAVCQAGSSDAADPTHYAETYVYSSQDLAHLAPRQPSGAGTEFYGIGHCLTQANFGGAFFWSEGHGWNNIATAGFVPHDQTLVRVASGSPTVYQNSYTLPTMPAGRNSQWGGPLQVLDGGLYLWTLDGSWADPASPPQSYEPVTLHVHHFDGLPDSWTEVDHLDTTFGDEVLNGGYIPVASAGQAGVLYLLVNLRTQDTIAGDAPRYNRVLSWDSTKAGTAAAWGRCELGELDPLNGPQLGGMFFEP